MIAAVVWVAGRAVGVVVVMVVVLLMVVVGSQLGCSMVQSRLAACVDLLQILEQSISHVAIHHILCTGRKYRPRVWSKQCRSRW